MMIALYRKRFLTFVIASFAAIAIHLLLLFWVHGLTITIYMPSHSFFGYTDENGKAPPRPPISKEEIQRKNDYLAQAFQETKESQNATPVANFDDVELEYMLSDLPQTEMPIATPMETPFIDWQEQLQDISFPNPAIDFAFSEEFQRMDQIVQASNVLFGSIETQELKNLENGIGMSIGRGEKISLIEEDSFQNRTGFIGIGADDTFAGSLPAVKDHDDFFKELKIENPKISFFDDTHANANLFDLNQIEFSSSQLGSIASSENFIVEVEYAPSESGYLFCLKLVPKRGVAFKHIRQNLFFLVDRSHSIGPQRYDTTKKAIMQVLPMLGKDDTFNILVFDTKIARMSAENLPFSVESLEKAEKFLSSQKYGGFMAATDLYSSLGNIVPDAVADTEVNTAILLSDGDTYLSKDNQRQTIGKWTERNAGKVSLFSVAAGKDNNLALLDLLSSLNKGSLHYTPEYDGIARTLQQLLYSIKNPVGKGMRITAVPKFADTRLSVYPLSNRAPDLYEQKPYVIYGQTQDLKDFYLFVQGKYYDKWLDIKHLVTFKKAKRIPKEEIEKAWALQQAYDVYDGYIREGHAGYLIQAERLLAPFNIPLAFQ